MSIKQKTKILIIAHPDDEALWFNPLLFDKIFIAFLDRPDNKKVTEGRKKVLAEHPLKNKIECFNLSESGYYWDNDKMEEYRDSFDALLKKLKGVMKKGIEIYTHNQWGEYGQTDHMLVHTAVMEIAGRYGINVYCFNGIDKLETSNEIWHDVDVNFNEGLKKLYLKYDAWTYGKDDYVIKNKMSYFKII